MEIYINKDMQERAARVREQQELAKLAKEYPKAETCASVAMWLLSALLLATLVYLFLTR